MSWKRLNYTEPAVLRGIVTALVAVALAFGVTVPTAWEDQAEQIIVGIGVLAPIVAGLWTRRAVTPVGEVIDPADEAAATEGLPPGAGVGHGQVD